MKTRKLFQVRNEIGYGCSSKQIGHKMRLMDRSKAMRVVKFLKKRGVNAFIAPMLIAA